MPAPYNVFLASLGSNGLAQGAKDGTRALLLEWFTEVAKGSSFSGAQVSWVTEAPATIQNTELLVYFVPNSIERILSSMPGYKGGQGEGGTTIWAGNLTGSEVYVSASRAYLAQMAFHECMHNKLHLQNSLHSQDGLARVPVTAGQRPSPDNFKRMREALGRNQPQWTGGFSAWNDPLRGL